MARHDFGQETRSKKFCMCPRRGRQWAPAPGAVWFPASVLNEKYLRVPTMRSAARSQ